MLLRAFDGEGNAYPIEEFILAAEQTDVISIIDLQVIIHTMQELPAYVELGIVQAGVNISPISCKYREFRKSVESLLEEHRSLCPYLVFEITEMSEGIEHASLQAWLEKLRSYGVQIAIDDFGKGNAGLARALNMPFGLLKLDKSIAWECEKNHFARALIGKIIEAVTSEGKEVVAEGIETEQQAKIMSQMGSRYLQGYLWTAPMPEKAYRQWIIAHA